MKSSRNRQMTIGFIASVLVVTLTAVVAGSAFAAGPNPATSPRKAYQPVVKDLNDIDADLAAVLKRQPNKRDLKDLVERLNALTKRIDKQESRVESLLAQDPVPPSADLTAASRTFLRRQAQLLRTRQLNWRTTPVCHKSMLTQ